VVIPHTLPNLSVIVARPAVTMVLFGEAVMSLQSFPCRKAGARAPLANCFKDENFSPLKLR
jgi:hypothetical protein